MGWATFHAGKVDLYLTFMHAADAGRIEQWRRSFQRASEILFHATAGQMQIGTCYVSNDYANKLAADAWLYELAGKSGSSTNHMLLCADERFRPYIIVHEFGHYMFGLRDEYKTEFGGDSQCIIDPLQQACIMEHPAHFGDAFNEATGQLTLGQVNEFCGPPATTGGPFHDPTSSNAQQACHGKSCWETIAEKFGFEIPDYQRPFVETTPEGHNAITWMLLGSTGQYSVILDNSENVAGTATSRGQFSGTHFLIDYFSAQQEYLGLISSNGDELFALQPLADEQTQQAAIGALNAMQTIAAPNHAAALKRAEDDFARQSVEASVRAIVLLDSQSTQVAQPPPAGIRVFTVGLGTEADASRLSKLSTMTHGQFEFLPATLDDAAMQFAVQTHLSKLVDELQVESGIVVATPGVIPATAPRSATRATQRLADRRLTMVTENAFEQAVLIEDGCENAAFVLSLARPASAELSLLSPAGRIIKPTKPGPRAEDDTTFAEKSASGQGAVQVVDRTELGYVLIRVDAPATGCWLMRITRNQDGKAIPFELLAISHNRQLHIDFDVAQVPGTRTLRISAEVYFAGCLTGIEPPVVELTPWTLWGGRTSTPPLAVVLRRPVVNVDDHAQGPYGAAMEVDGPFEAEIDLPGPGTYAITGRFANAGTAKCNRCCEPAASVRGVVPRFLRYKRRQVTVE